MCVSCYVILCAPANILNTLRRGGNILIAVDTAGRVLELSQLLVRLYCLFHMKHALYLFFKDQMWRNQESGLCAYHLALLNNVSYNVVEFAKSQVSTTVSINKIYHVTVFCLLNLYNLL